MASAAARPFEKGGTCSLTGGAPPLQPQSVISQRRPRTRLAFMSPVFDGWNLSPRQVDGSATLIERVQDGLASTVYALTRICSVGYIKRVESAFEVIAEPNRRAILNLLVSSQRSVGEIERQLRMPQPTVSKHLRVLREAGFVESTVDAQRRLYRLKPEPLQEVDAWLAPFRRFWSAHVDALERHLDRMDQLTPRKRKTSRR
jgi:DNA-binding transcriptional ArsR family regulator